MQTQAHPNAAVGAVQPLDLHEGISDPRPVRGCARWPEHLKLANLATGELFEGRCRATNLCEYCRTLYVVETVEMLTLDAIEHAPTIWCVLTARAHLTRRDTYRHLEQLRKSLRKRWPVEWFVQVEFQRRGALHLNLLVKGVPVGQLDELRRAVNAIWCARVDAEPVGQWYGAVEDGVGVVRYISKMLAHGLKKEQAPPIGWRGHRTSQTRGYLVRPASEMRVEARRALRIKRALWRGESLEVAEHAADNPDPFALYREHGYKQTGRVADLSPSRRQRGARGADATSHSADWTRAYVEWLRSLGALDRAG
jgi:hypothetical protein